MASRKPTTRNDPVLDLDVEDIRLPDGSRLTEAKVDEIAERAHRRHPGRFSINGERERTAPRSWPCACLALLVPRSKKLRQPHGRRLADVSREALDEYIRRHAS